MHRPIRQQYEDFMRHVFEQGVAKADRTAVMDGGRIVDSDRHDELAARGGLYARLAAMQFGLDDPVQNAA